MKEHLPKILGALVLLVWVGVAVYVPPNMDEFIHYHPISCNAFENAHYNQFEEACGKYDLEVFGEYLPLRSYYYTGFTSSLFYWPIWSVWNHPYSARFLGIISLGVLLLGLRLLFRWNATTVLGVFGLSFPIVFQSIVDTGPVAFQLAALVWIPLFARWIVSEKSLLRRFGLNLALAVVTFVAIEKKPLFLQLLPAVMIFTYLDLFGAIRFNSRDDRSKVWKNLKSLSLAIWPAVAITGLLVSILFFSKDRSGVFYFDVLKDASTRFAIYDLWGQFRHLKDVVLKFFLFQSEFAHRHFFGPSLWIAGLLSAPVLMAGVRMLRRSAEARLLGVAFFLVLWLLNLNTQAWAGHHFVFPFFLFLIVLAAGLEKVKNPIRTLSVVAISQLLIFGATFGSNGRIDAHWESWDWVAAAHSQSEEGRVLRESAVLYLDWGNYYIHALYGPPDQMVSFYPRVKKEEQVLEILDWSKNTGRPLAILSHLKGGQSQLELLETHLTCEAPRAYRRQVWRMLTELGCESNKAPSEPQ